MNNKNIIFLASGFVIGALCGYVLGSQTAKSKYETELQTQAQFFKNEMDAFSKPAVEGVEADMPGTMFSEAPEDPVIISSGPAKLASVDTNGIDYSAYSKKVQELKDIEASEHPTDGDDTELEDEEESPIIPIEDYEEDYETRVDRELREINEQLALYSKKKRGQIDVLGKNPVDPDWPDITYPQTELLYFIPDDELTDESGKVIEDRDSVVGVKLRRFGWFHNDQEDIWVRNNDISNPMDYHITKINETRKDYFNVDAIDDL